MKIFRLLIALLIAAIVLRAACGTRPAQASYWAKFDNVSIAEGVATATDARAEGATTGTKAPFPIARATKSGEIMR